MKNSVSHSRMTAKKCVADLISVTTDQCPVVSSYNLNVNFLLGQAATGQ